LLLGFSSVDFRIVALKCDEFITAEKPGKPLHKARGLKVSFLPSV
jgi:hypothetical protein